MSEIHVTRRPNDAGSLRAIKVYVDDELATKLRPGEEATIAVSPGKHTVQGRMDWVKSTLEEMILKNSENAMVDFWLPEQAAPGIFNRFRFSLRVEVRR